MNKFFPVLQIALFGFMGFAHLKLTGDFWCQLPTLFWEKTTVVVTSNELKDSPHHDGPMGTIHFKIVGDDASRAYSDHFSERYGFGDVPAKTASFIATYATGSVHTGYIAPDRSRVSIGHFPRSYGYSFLITGTLFTIATFISWKQLRLIMHEKE